MTARQFTPTRQVFEQSCADARGLTVDELRARGYYTVPCTCGADACAGWALEHREHA